MAGTLFVELVSWGWILLHRSQLSVMLSQLEQH